MSLELEDGTPVREGLRVRKQQLLGKLDDADALARQQAADLDQKVEQAELKKSDATIKAADAKVKVFEAEVVESESINRKAPGSVPATTVRRQGLQVEMYRVEAEVARREAESGSLRVASKGAQLDVATINVERHGIPSPLDGHVVQLYKHAGEWVNPGDPILRIVYLDRVRVEGFVDIRNFLPEEVAGRPVKIIVRTKNRQVTLDSVISFVSPLVEGVRGEYRVWAEVENKEVNGHPLLLPGVNVEMEILLGPGAKPSR
jgi:multidrug resistance efflux pump